MPPYNDSAPLQTHTFPARPPVRQTAEPAFHPTPTLQVNCRLSVRSQDGKRPKYESLNLVQSRQQHQPTILPV